jgi:hypothetical protein
MLFREGASVVERVLAETWVSQAVPTSALSYGFAIEPVGTHISRTMMLEDLRRLLAACPSAAQLPAYYAAAVEENVLLKPTVTARRRAIRRLKELYRLDPGVVLFHALRDLWDDDPPAQPLLALLCAAATDPIVRVSADIVLGLGPGETITPQQLEGVVREYLPGRYSAASLASVGRNLASTWQQSGHLSGKQSKMRSQAECRPNAVAYALLLGFLCDERGEGLFHTLWARLLDLPIAVLHAQAFAASQRGWIEYRRSGDVTEIGFRHLLRIEQ